MLRKRLVGAGGPPPGDNWPGPGKQWSLKHYWTENNEAALCMCCQHRKFTMTVRRHHCRQVGPVTVPMGPCLCDRAYVPSRNLTTAVSVYVTVL